MGRRRVYIHEMARYSNVILRVCILYKPSIYNFDVGLAGLLYMTDAAA